ncbi:hypothetical protein DPEC_G00171610 [Dallia pectoralis]|uniref:Uncharacterized protein n=1 Tax=Dallia pectoralis TaxID=75939 RepID=A0ACC2GDA7_DALPE|nr:hypothetical protein DPEC_G00171610 [Dallia pectoralis]
MTPSLDNFPDDKDHRIVFYGKWIRTSSRWKCGPNTSDTMTGHYRGRPGKDETGADETHSRHSHMKE